MWPVYALRRSKFFIFSLAIGCILTVLATVDRGHAATKQLLLTPVRAIFTDRQRSVAIHVNNSGQETISYKISLVTMRKDKDGQLREVQVETDEEKMIKDMIRLSPKRATIKSGERQIVKLMVRKPENLPEGEYQTRLRFSPLASSPQSGSGGHKGTTVNVEMLVSSTIPVVIQHGNVTPEVTPADLKVVPGRQKGSDLQAELRLKRQGKGSAFGVVSLDYIPANNPKSLRRIGNQEGVVIYLPETERKIIVPLHDISRQELSSGKVRVSFRHDTGSGYKRKAASPNSIKDFIVH